MSGSRAASAPPDVLAHSLASGMPPIGSIVPQAVIDFPEMLLGADFFRSHRIYVAMSQKKVYASYIGGPVFKLRETSAAPK